MQETVTFAVGSQHTNYNGTYKVVSPVVDGNVEIMYTSVAKGCETRVAIGDKAVVDAARQVGIVLHCSGKAAEKTGSRSIPIPQRRSYAFTLGMIAQCGRIHADLKPGNCEMTFRGDYQMETGNSPDDTHISNISNPRTWGNRLSVSAPFDCLAAHPKYFDVTTISGTEMDDDSSKVCANVWVMNLINMGFRLGRQNGEQILDIMETHRDPLVRDMAADFVDGLTEDLTSLLERKTV